MMQIGEHRSLYNKRQIAPAARVGGRAHILTGDVHAAHHRRCVVDDDYFAMVAQIGAAAKGQMHHRHEKGVTTPGVQERREHLFRNAKGPERI